MGKIKSIGIVNILFAFVLISFVLPPQILNPICLGILFSFGLVRKVITRKNFETNHFNKVSFYFIFYFVILLSSLLYSEDLRKGIGVIGGSLSYFIVPFIPLFFSKEDVDLKFITKFYLNLICILFFVLFFVAVYKNYQEGYTLEYVLNSLSGTDVIETGKYRYINYWYFIYDKFASPIDMQPIYLGMFTNLALVFLLFSKGDIKEVFFNIKLGILSCFILLLASRSQILIFIFNYLIFIVFFDKSKFWDKIPFLMFFPTIFFALAFTNPVMRTRISEAFSYKEAFYEDSFGGTSLRIKKWKSAVRTIKNSPFIGFGVGDGKNELMKQYKIDKFYLGYYNKFNAHNQYLDTVLYVGVFGLIAIFLIFYYSYVDSVDNPVLLFISNIFGIGFITESMLNRQWGIIAFAFFLIIFSTFKLNKSDS
ncbi:O-antigen ligase [Mangrovimonas sp. DI 80]|uniref:O-antigen ligase family protein n=1 Tax=Mangrovimonas sp. DI 80 TaxID=1779330 RepID=UPI0009783DDB|nr:O-antigen ligase family protein [Mangrovimonas sp. DI 80]OMP32200.1 hypothetical protein BKM32_03885 [Mangrovimonas sp. DI 80]